MRRVRITTMGPVIKRVRISKQLSQEEVAMRSDLNLSFISNIERAKQLPGLDSFQAIAEAYEMNGSDLYSLVENYNKELMTATKNKTSLRSYPVKVKKPMAELDQFKGLVTSQTQEKVQFPDQLMEGMSLECLFVSPFGTTSAFAALTEKEQGQYIVRLYHLQKRQDGNLHPTHELAAYSFNTRKEMKDFVKRLPQMTVIELLMAIKPEPTQYD